MRHVLLGLRVQHEDRQVGQVVDVLVQVGGRVGERLERRVERLQLLLVDAYEGVERSGEVIVVVPGTRTLREVG